MNSWTSARYLKLIKSLIQHCERSELYLHLNGQKLIKNAKNGPFWKLEACGQMELPDRSILIGQKLVENATFWVISNNVSTRAVAQLLLKAFFVHYKGVNNDEVRQILTCWCRGVILLMCCSCLEKITTSQLFEGWSSKGDFKIREISW